MYLVIIITLAFAAFVCALVALVLRTCIRQLETDRDNDRDNEYLLKALRKEIHNFRVAAYPSAKRRFDSSDNGYSHRVCVFADGCVWPVYIIKEFPYDPADPDDKAFARRNAEELIEKLSE